METAIPPIRSIQKWMRTPRESQRENRCESHLSFSFVIVSGWARAFPLCECS